MKPSISPTVLVIDDERDILKALKDTLSQEHFSVVTASTGEAGIQMTREKKPDVIVLDLRLPDMDGYDVCRCLKSDPSTAQIPILMLSTRSKDTEKIVGLEIGADDYLTKPYNPLELVARLRVALRRRASPPLPAAPLATSLESGPLRLNTESRIAMLGKTTLKLTRKEFDVLAVMLEKPGKAFTRRALLERVWGVEHDSFQGTVDTHMKTIRKKLGDAASYLETVTGIGYRWAAEDN